MKTTPCKTVFHGDLFIDVPIVADVIKIWQQQVSID